MKFVLALSISLSVQVAKAVCEKPDITDFEYICPEFTMIYTRTTGTEHTRLTTLTEEDRAQETSEVWTVEKEVGFRRNRVRPTSVGATNYRFTSCVEIYKIKLEEYKICLESVTTCQPEGSD